MEDVEPSLHNGFIPDRQPVESVTGEPSQVASLKLVDNPFDEAVMEGGVGL